MDTECILVPSIAVFVPLYNEEQTIRDSIKALINIDYPELEIILINDGSKDKTLNILKEYFRLFPIARNSKEEIKTRKVNRIFRSATDQRVLVIDKENGGKADAQNAGINYSRSRLFCVIDGDSLVEKDALKKLIMGYLDRTSKVIGLGGIIRIVNDCIVEDGKVVKVRLSKKILPAIQAMEYIRAFLCGRSGLAKINSMLIIAGAFGLFERKTVIECGGYKAGSLAEDMELVVRVHRKMRELNREYKFVFIPDPVCWTQAPDSLKVLARQRIRWGQGLIEVMRNNLKMLFNPKYGVIGLFAMPYFFFFEMLGPLVELSGYVIITLSFIFNLINYEFFVLFLGVAILFGVLLSLFSLLLEEYTVKRYENPWDIIKLFLLAIIENFGYRQINSWWRLKAFFKREKSWGDMERKTFT